MSILIESGLLDALQAENDAWFAATTLGVTVLLYLSGVLRYDLPGRWKLFAMSVVTLWGVRLAYFGSSWVSIGNLGLWLLIYNAIADDDDHGHSHGEHAD